MVFTKLFKKPINNQSLLNETEIQENHIKKILNTEYFGLLHDLMINGSLEDIIKNNPNRLEQIEDLKQYLEYTNIPIKAVSAIYHYSISNKEMMGVRKGFVTKEDLKENAYMYFRSRLYNMYPAEVSSKIEKQVMEYFNSYDFEKNNYYRLTEDTTLFCKNLDILPLPVLNLAYDLNRLEKAKKHNTILDDLLANHTLKIIDINKPDNFVKNEDVVLYRAVQSRFLKKKCNGDLTKLTGQKVKNDFPTSTSKDYNRSFCHRKNLDLIFEIKINSNTKGIDMEALSEYGTAESEILLAQNEFLIENVEYRADNRGQMKYFAKCTLLQKELTKDNNKDIETTNYEIEERDEL